MIAKPFFLAAAALLFPLASFAGAPLASPPPANCTIFDITWGRGLVLFNVPGRTPLQTMNTNQMYAFRRTVQANEGPEIAGAMYTNVSHQFSVSTNPCEWTAEHLSTYCGSTGTEAGVTTSTRGEPYTCAVTAGTTIYYNIRNADVWNGPDTCPASVTCTYNFFW